MNQLKEILDKKNVEIENFENKNQEINNFHDKTQILYEKIEDLK